jgi:hypothetical protein
MSHVSGGAEEMKAALRLAATLSGQRNGPRPKFVVIFAALTGVGLVACGGPTDRQIAEPSTVASAATNPASQSSDSKDQLASLAEQGYVYGVVYRADGTPAANLTFEMYSNGREPSAIHGDPGSPTGTRYDAQTGRQYPQLSVTTSSQGVYSTPICAQSCPLVIAAVGDRSCSMVASTLQSDIKGGRADWKCEI